MSNMAKLARRDVQPRNDGLPSTQELLEDSRTSFLCDLTSPANAEVDLVAVHGLNLTNARAHGVRTWTAGAKGEERLWLKDFLPHRLPNVRVLLYSYNSNAAFHTSSAGIGDIAEDLLQKLWSKRQSAPDRPLVFVCHSLGGLVVKRAIVKARTIPRYFQIDKSAKSFAFFATPHRGGMGAGFGQKAAGLVRVFGSNPRNDILEVLRKDSQAAPTIHDDFVDGQDDYHVCTFFECRPMPLQRSLVVDKSSAVLGLGGAAEIRIPCVDADHSTICKFATEDETYRFIIDEIEELVNWSMIRSVRVNMPDEAVAQPLSPLSDTLEISDSISDSSVPPSSPPIGAALRSEDGYFTSIADEPRYGTIKGPYFLVPYAQNPDFVGFQDISHQLRMFSDPYNNPLSAVALSGLGGSGKSQIALEHAYWYKLNYPRNSVFWLDASSPDQLCASLEMIAAHCGISRLDDTSSDTLERIDQWLLDKNNGSWLMIVDGVNDMDILTGSSDKKLENQHDYSTTPRLPRSIGHQIPIAAHGKVLFTTNNRSLGNKLAAQGLLLEVQRMKKQDACALIRKQLAVDALANPQAMSPYVLWSDTDVEILAEALDYLPLALAQATAYMRQNQMSIQKYVQLMMKNDQEMGVFLETDFLADSNNGYSSKAIMSTWKIGFDWIETYHKGAAELLSFMAFLEPIQIPRGLLEQYQPSDGKSISQIIRVLEEYSFISANSDNTFYDMHRLIQIAIRKRLAVLRTEVDWNVKATELLSSQFPDPSYKTWKASAALLPHALKVLSFTFDGNIEPLPLGTLQAKVGWYYYLRGHYKQADAYTLQAVDNFIFAPGVSQSDVLDIKTKRVYVQKELGRFEEAEDLAQEVWRGRRTTPDTKPEELAKSIELLSVIYQEQGKYKVAEKVIRKVLKSLKRGFDANDIQVILSKRRLGTILHYLGRYTEAEKYLREATQSLENRPGDHYLTLLKIKWRLAWVLHAQGRYKEAEEIDYKVWKIQVDLLGPDHPDTLKSLYGLSNDLQAQRKFSEAEAHKREVYRQACAKVGETHLNTLFAASSLASCLIASSLAASQPIADQLAEAEELYMLVFTTMEHNLRLDHPSTLAARTDVAIIRRLRQSAQLPDIENFERETLTTLKKTLGKKHPVTIKSRDNLARTLWAQRDVKMKEKEALKQAKKVLAARVKRHGWAHKDTQLAAELVVEMLPIGGKRDVMKSKLDAARTGG